MDHREERPSEGLGGLGSSLFGGVQLSQLFPFVERSVSYVQGFRQAASHLSALERAASGSTPWPTRRLAVQTYLASQGPAVASVLPPFGTGVPSALADSTLGAGSAATSPFLAIFYGHVPELRPGSVPLASADVTEERFRVALRDAAGEARRRAANAASLASAAGCLVQAKATYDLVQELREAKDGWHLDGLEVSALVKDARDVHEYVDLLRAHLASLDSASAEPSSTADPSHAAAASSSTTTTAAPPDVPDVPRAVLFSRDHLETIDELVVDVQHRLRDLGRRIDDTKIVISERKVALQQLRAACNNQALTNAVFTGVRGVELAYMGRNMSTWAWGMQVAALVGHVVAGAVAVHHSFDAKRTLERVVELLRVLAKARDDVDALESDFYAIQRGLRPHLRAIME